MIAVIESGSKQYMVEKGHQIKTELLHSDQEEVEFRPLIIIDGDNIQIGKPKLEGATVKAKIISADIKADKVKILKYKAKKRQKTLTGHRQRHTILEITAIKTK
ncbi:50S ribosomal protein L21 [Candidatus Saccharibacteria bacterium]|nr:50S ribosomal protein L21 [Candidatus Saccharibacteria bacterium]